MKKLNTIANDKKMFIDLLTSTNTDCIIMDNIHKLTKKYFMSLPEGSFLVSNIVKNSMQPVFAEKVIPLNLRKNQWDRIVEVGAQQRECHIFETEMEFKNWLSELNYNISKNKKKIDH